jgi:predicted N-formylglutamate amidohydrolase
VYGDDVANPAVLVEVRQDLLVQPAEQERWAQRLATALAIDVALEAVKQV